MIKTLKKVWQDLNPIEKSYLKAGLYLIGVIGFVSIIVMPWVITRKFWSFVDYNSTGAIGDTINGIAGPFIALLAAILTFLAFYIQYKANVQQREQFTRELSRQQEEAKDQERVWRIDRFENRFYELLRMHKANVNEMNIAGKVTGRKCFVQMFYELKCCYQTSESFFNSTPQDSKAEYEYDKINLLDFAYRIFFFGIGLHSEKHFIHSLKKGDFHLFRQVKPFLGKIQEKVLAHFKEYPASSYYTHNLPLSGIPDEKTVEFYYFPFDGHVNRLGHYYRHLFQTANYVTSQSSELLPGDEKYSYLKTLRAQLSNYEQLMLYYNALAWFDEEWKPLFTTYRLIKNLPLPLADFYRKPEVHFEKEIEELRERGLEMFEWHE